MVYPDRFRCGLPFQYSHFEVLKDTSIPFTYSMYTLSIRRMHSTAVELHLHVRAFVSGVKANGRKRKVKV